MSRNWFYEKKEFIYVPSFVLIFYLTQIFSADMINQKTFYSGGSSYPQLSGNGLGQSGGVEGSALLPTPPTFPIMPGTEGYKWQKDVSDADALNYVVGNEVNWQERKALKQKTNDYYNKILKLIEDSQGVFDKFRSKIQPIRDLQKDLQKEIDQKAILFENNIGNENQLFVFFDSLVKYWEAIKLSNLYKLNKEFREKVDELSFSLNNIAKMKNHFYSSKNEFYHFIDIVVNSLNELQGLQEKITFYEDLAWGKYDQLDELIAETEANNNYYIVINCFDNIVLISNYLRSDYLTFINNAIYELSNANDSIMVLFNTIGNSIIEIQKNIVAFDMEVKAYDLAEKQKEIAEQQEKIEEERKKERQLEKKQREELAALNQRSFFVKLIDQIKIHYDYTKKYVSTMIEKLKIFLLESYLVKRIQEMIGKNNSIQPVLKAIKSDKESVSSDKKEISSEVSKAVSDIEAAQDGAVSTEVYTVNSIIANQKVPQLSPEQLVKEQATQEKTDFKNEFDSFDAERAYIPLVEKKKLGGSSYPVKIQPMMVVGDAQYNTQDSAIFGVDDTVIQPIQEEKSDTTIIKAPHNSFKYSAIDTSEARNSGSENENLVPDLSSQQNASSSRGAGLNLGISGELTKRLSFAEESDSRQRQSRSRKDRESGARNQKKKKKVVRGVNKITPHESASLTTN